MNQHLDNEQRHPPKAADFVRKYLYAIFLIISLIVLSAFWGFSSRSNALLREQLLDQGRAFFEEMVLIRAWAAKHGGV